jgi:hypothetical protein
MIHGHEENVDGDAKRDEKFGEWIKNEDRQTLADPDPNPSAIPDAKNIDQLFSFFRLKYHHICDLDWFLC